MRNLMDLTSFGAIDADNDDLLETSFQDHEAYTLALDHSRFLVLGRKGSGKTAIFKKIVRTRAFDFFSFGHTFSDYPWDFHNRQATQGVPEEERFTQSWKYLSLLTVTKILLNQDQSQAVNPDVFDSLASLESFIVDSYGTRDPDVSQVFSPHKRLRIRPSLKFTMPDGSGTVDAGVELEQVPMGEFPRVAQELNRHVLAMVVRCLHPEHHYYVCFDQLDLGFDPNNPLYAQRLTGLVLAARDINLAAKEAGKMLSIVVFLRDDIFQALRFEDKNKIDENYASRIEWDTGRSPWTLKSLMQRRFSSALGSEERGAWERVFDETKEMRGRQTKYAHILDRTLHRPRDIIKFCNEVLSAYQQRGGDSDDRFKNEDVILARDEYSQYLLKELDDEIFKHIPEYEDYVELLRAMGKLQFSRDEMDQVREQRRGLATATLTTTEILAGLFNFSIVGFLKAGGGLGGSQYVWRYLDSRARFDSSAQYFKVHPGFKEVLDLKEGRRAGG